MKHYSSYLTDRQVELLLSTIESGAYLSKRDGCRVVLAKCANCGRSFEEEVGEYSDVIIAGRAVLCLSCDPASVKAAFVGVTVSIGWEAE